MTPFVGPSYNLALRKADIQRSVNMHLVGLESPGKAPFVLQSVPGYTALVSATGAVRGTLSTNDRTFWVIGQTLYQQTDLTTLVARGTLSSTTGPVEMEYGLTQLVIVDGPNGYVLTLATNTFQKIISDGFYGSDTVTFVDNYFVFVRPDSGMYYIGGINDATTEDPLDFASAEAAPDDLVATIAVQRRLLALGSRTIEIEFDAGSADFPFQREGTTVEVGCLAAHSVRTIDNTAFWIGQDKNGGGIVYRLNGYQPVRISTQGIEQALQASTDLTQATAYAYQENGLTFYAINAPGLTSTWVYEVSTSSWAERCDQDAAGQLKADRGVCHNYAFGQHLIGGDDGVIYKLDHSVHTKAGQPLVRKRVSPHSAVKSRKFVFFDAMHIDCTTGDAPQGVDPHLQLKWSNDSGASFGNAILLPTGRVGERGARVSKIGGLGRSRDRVWDITFTDNARFDLIDVDIESHLGTS